MKIKQSLDVGGVSCAISFQASPEGLRRLLEDSGRACGDEALEEYFLQQADQAQRLLSQALQSFRSGLMVSYTEALRAGLSE